MKKKTQIKIINIKMNHKLYKTNNNIDYSIIDSVILIFQ